MWLGQASQGTGDFSFNCSDVMQLTLQVWNLTNCKLKTNHFGHNGFLNCVTVSPDGSLCASGGKVGRVCSVRSWDV